MLAGFWGLKLALRTNDAEALGARKSETSHIPPCAFNTDYSPTTRMIAYHLQLLHITSNYCKSPPTKEPYPLAEPS